MQLNMKKIVGTAVLLAASYSVIPSAYGKLKHRIDSRQIDKSEKTIYLTFDDGPSEYTDSLLDLLKEYQVKATFFVVAEFAREHQDTIKRMVKEGHTIGLHSLSHRSAMIQTPGYTKNEFDISVAIMNQMDIDVKYYRPPWGQVNICTFPNLEKHKLTEVLWDVMAEDWRGDSTIDEIVYKLLYRTKNGSVVCLHDGRGENCAPLRTIEALKTVIPIWKDEGYVFDTIEMRRVKSK